MGDGFDVAGVAGALDDAVRAAGTPERAGAEARYLHSGLVHYGSSVPSVRAAVRAMLAAHPGLTHDQLIDVVRVLWDEPEAAVHERRLAAAVLLAQRHAQLGLDDMPLAERLLREARTWALVDVLSGDALGPALDLLTDQHAVSGLLDRWVADDDFWIRRSALLTHQRPLRAGQGDWERFAGYADSLLEDREFFIRKAIGWVLREASRQRRDQVFGWLLPRAARASGVTIKEAVKYLTPQQREEVLAGRG